jgi:hypothetical protein
MPRLFIAYPRLDQWVEEQKVALDGDQLTTSDGKRYHLSAAVCFLSLVGSDADPHQLLGKVKTESQLEALRAEHIQNSVLVGEVGYQVMEGFVGEPV